MARLIAGVKDTDDIDLDGLITSWKRTMVSERKSPDTIRSYLTGVTLFASCCARQSRPIALDQAYASAAARSMTNDGNRRRDV